MNEHEARARSIKAFRLARVLVRLCRQFPQHDPDSLASAPERARLRAAEIAGVNPPSDETWRQALDLVRLWLDDRYRVGHADTRT